MNAVFLALAAGAAAAGAVSAGGKPAAPAVAASTAPAAVSPAEIPGLKRQIELDQKEILLRRADLRRAQRGRGEAAGTKAREAWLGAREKLKADRALLKRAIELSEADRADKSQPPQKNDRLKR